MVAGRGSRVLKKSRVFRRLHYRNNEEQNLRVNANFRKVKFTFIYLINANLRVFIRTIS